MTHSTIAPTGRTARTARPRIGGAAVATLALLVIGAPALAQTAPDDTWVPPPHVRPDPDLRALVDEAARRSPSIRALRAELETFDVTVYVRTRLLPQLDLDGRVALLSVNGTHRYLVIELSCARSRLQQMATLGHELFHALEIAREPSIVDGRSLAAFYDRIGVQTGDSIGRRSFETNAAAHAGMQARRELLINTTRSAHGS